MRSRARTIIVFRDRRVPRTHVVRAQDSGNEPQRSRIEDSNSRSCVVYEPSTDSFERADVDAASHHAANRLLPGTRASSVSFPCTPRDHDFSGTRDLIRKRTRSAGTRRDSRHAIRDNRRGNCKNREHGQQRRQWRGVYAMVAHRSCGWPRGVPKEPRSRFNGARPCFREYFNYLFALLNHRG